ncbi:MAG: mandelate racemase/muconate lactonizing enzyme family protein [Gaiella sp.]
MRITAVESRVYRFPLEPPFRAAWDPVPRAAQEATVVLVHSDEGVTGIASGGDGLPDRGMIEGFLVGLDPLRTEAVREVLETVDLHGGRPWAVEIAVWDLVGRALGEPLWKLLGGRSERLLAYASSGELVGPTERAARCTRLLEEGVRAVKIRFHHADWRDDVAVVRAVRETVGDRLAIMVDANQGWRMPGDREPRWDVAAAAQCAGALEELDVYWLEEPLRTDDVEGYAALRRRTSVRLAAGELVRQPHEARDLVVLGGVDVIQADVLFVGGIGGCRRIAALADLHGRAWSPHTWSNGLGFLANLHAALALSTVPYVEVPYDPPAWGPERRDWLLPEPVAIEADGTVAPPPGPGLGVDLDLEGLERWRVG